MTIRAGSFAKRLYLPRILGSAAGFWAVAAVLTSYALPAWVWVLLVFHGFVWPHVAYSLASRVRVSYHVERRNMLVESAFGGLWVAAMQFNALGCTLLMSMFCMNCIAVGGPRLLAISLPVMATSALAFTLLLGSAFLPQTSTAQVYACLPMLAVYPMAVAFAAYRLAAQLAEHKRQLKEANRMDSLTGLLNQGAWKDFLSEEFTAAGQRPLPTTLALIDIDCFKSINDVHGHLVGDEVIRLMSVTLRQRCRPTDIAGRLGGDEFGLVLRDTDGEQAKAIMARLKHYMREAFATRTDLPPITLSVGVSKHDATMRRVEDWVMASDSALYQAKREGRNRVILAEQASAAKTVTHAEHGRR